MHRQYLPALLVALFLVLGVVDVAGESIGSKVGGILRGSPSADTGNVNLTDHLILQIEERDDNYAQALLLLEALQTSPSCHRQAAIDLLDSCKFADRGRDEESDLESLKSLYGARLAICEIREARSATPSECTSIFVSLGSSHHDKHGKFGITSPGYDNSDQRGLTACLGALQSRVQHWVSYSNNRQQAVVMCQASRSDVEREKTLEFYKNLVKVTNNVGGTLEDIVRRAEENEKLHQKFIEEVRALQGAAYQGLAKETDAASEKIAALNGEIDALKDVLRQNVQDSRTWSSELQRGVQQAFQFVYNGRAELAAKDIDSAQMNQAMALGLVCCPSPDIFVVGTDGTQQATLENIENIALGVHTKFSQVEQAIEQVGDRIEQHDAMLDHIQHHQLVQAEQVMQLIANMTESIHVIFTLTESIGDLFSNMKSTIYDLMTDLSMLRSIAAPLRMFSGWCVYICVFVWLYVLSRFHEALARYFAATGGLCIIIFHTMPGLLTVFSGPIALHPSNATLITLFLFSSSVVLAAAGVVIWLVLKKRGGARNRTDEGWKAFEDSDAYRFRRASSAPL